MLPSIQSCSRVATVAVSALLASQAIAQSVGAALQSLDIAPPSIISRARDFGPSDPTEAIRFTICLPYADSDAVSKFVDDVSDPASPRHRQFITPEQVGSRFGLPVAKVQRVADYLRTNGIRVTNVAKTRLTIQAEGTIAQVEHAFHTPLREYISRLPEDSAKPRFRAFTQAPRVPAPLKPLILSIAGLETYSHPRPMALEPGQLRSLYNAAPLYSGGYQGQGRTIAFSNWDGFYTFTLADVYARWGLPTPPRGIGSNVDIVPIGAGSFRTFAHGEGDLDLQAILNVAPLANVIVYDGDNKNYNLIDVLTREADDNHADIISESWEWYFAESSTPVAANNLHRAMSAQGITYMSASGDTGTKHTYFYPHDDPEVLSVGGTTAAVDANGQRSSETAWGGGGGGWIVNSQAYNVRPKYQRIPALPELPNHRLNPDIALNADPRTGYWVYQIDGKGANWGFYVIGGTSGSSPTFAAGLALAQQKMIDLGTLPPDDNGHYRHGRIQDLIYSFKGKSLLLFDVTVGQNGNLPDGTTSTAKSGWDYTTGWGVLDFNAFANSGTVPPVIKSFTIAPTSVTGGTSLPITGTITLDHEPAEDGATIRLTNSSSFASAPATVFVPAGAKTATFNVTTSTVGSSKTATLTATLGKSVKSASLTIVPVVPPSYYTFTLSTTRIVANSVVTATVTLNQPALSGGFVVNLTSNRPALLTVPASVTVPADYRTVSFPVTAGSPFLTAPATITARHERFANRTTGGTVYSPVVESINLPNDPLVGGQPTSVTVRLASPAGPDGCRLGIASSTTYAPLSATLTVPARASSITIPLSVASVGSPKLAQLRTLTSGNPYVFRKFTIVPALLGSIVVTPNPIKPGDAVVGTIKLKSAAPAGGYLVTISSSDPTLLSISRTVLVPYGATSAAFTGSVSAPSTSTVVTITASIDGQTPVATDVTINP